MKIFRVKQKIDGTWFYAAGAESESSVSALFMAISYFQQYAEDSPAMLEGKSGNGKWVKIMESE